MSGERERNIRERAYAIWEQEGRVPKARALIIGYKQKPKSETKKVIGITNDGKILKSSRSTVVARS
jgi:hypothetical protein